MGTWPQSVSFYTLMGVQAARRSSYCGGGWRLYVLAKNLDPRGLGMIARDELIAYAHSLGLSDRQRRRWMNEARAADLLRDVQAQDGHWLLILPSAGHAAVAMRAPAVGRKVSMDAAGLIGKGWRARVWGAYQTTHNGQPITRRRLQAIVNVPVSTQRYRDAQAHVKRTRNIAKSAMRDDRLASEQEYSDHKGIFLTRDGFVGWHLPNAYAVPFAQRGGRGRARKANLIIRVQSTHDDALSQMRQGLSCDAEGARDVIRLFNRTVQARKASFRKLARLECRVSEIYEQGPTAPSGAVLWAPWGAE